jgi:hypothetical protein
MNLRAIAEQRFPLKSILAGLTLSRFRPSRIKLMLVYSTISLCRNSGLRHAR